MSSMIVDIEKVEEGKKTVDDWLDEVNYHDLNAGNYIPSDFALKFMNMIKLINGAEGESHKTPVVHLKMLDKMVSPKHRIANLCHRGIAKTTLFFEYLIFYVAIFRELPNFGELDSMIYVSDSMDNGVKSARKNIEFRYYNSDFLQEYLPEAKFTDNYIEFVNKEGKRFGVKMFGAKALSLDTELYLAAGGTTTIGSAQIGDIIIGANGEPTQIYDKSQIFHRPMYRLELEDGRTLKVCEEHLNQVWIKRFQSEKTFSKFTLEEGTYTTKELLQEPLYAIDPKGSQRPLLWIQNIEPMMFMENQDQLLDPYTVGLLIGDGSLQANVVLTGDEPDWEFFKTQIPYALGKIQRDSRRLNVISRTVQGITHLIRASSLDCHGNHKFVPEDYKFASVKQRLAVLQGLMDTDGTVTKEGKASFCSASKILVEDVMWLVRSLGGTARWQKTGKENAWKCGVRLQRGMSLFRLPRKREREKFLRNNKVSIKAITRIADEPSQCISVEAPDNQYTAGNNLIRTHNTGIRGTKIFGKRPKLAVLDDLVSDEDARSKAAMEAINDTVYKGIDYALDPTRRKIIFNGTPFNKKDILYQAVESGAWDVNVWPVCEKFPCTREEFAGSWEDRFTYDYVVEQYNDSVKAGKISAFLQELMLRISSEDERLVQDSEIRWYDRASLLRNRGAFNFFITTDFATTDRQASDNSVISVWAYNSNRDWFWVDGVCARQKMPDAISELFRLVSTYRPQSVGVEISGQQSAFIDWLQEQQLTRNVWFNFAMQKNRPGIRPVSNKLERFNLVVPWFAQGKIFFPAQMKDQPIMRQFVSEISLATRTGLKGQDDCLDTISQLAEIGAWPPSEEAPDIQSDDIYGDDIHEEPSSIDSYIV